jgi:CO/xanthine dehydrogenase FAD-binding subunit
MSVSLKTDETKIFRPKSLSGALRLYAKNPDALLFAGGTEIIPNLLHNRRLSLPEKVICLQNIQELDRLARSQRYLDIGACVTLARILSIGRHVIPTVLLESLQSVGTSTVRTLATLGGNIYGLATDSLCALSVVESQLDLRRVSATRWVHIAVDAIRPPEAGEILCRIRIPLEQWDLQVFHKVGIGNSVGGAQVIFAGVTRQAKVNSSIIRFALGAAGLPIFRDRELESALVGRLPFGERRCAEIIQTVAERLPWPEGYQKATSLRMVRGFLNSINQKSKEIL